jgi:hypothetical protein
MKKLFILLLILSNCFGIMAQTTNFFKVYRYSNYDTIRVDRHFAVCDTMDHIFRIILDSFKPAINVAGSDTGQLVSRGYNLRLTGRPPAGSDNIITGSPFAFYSPYLSGKDSASMFREFNVLLTDVQRCLLNGAAKDLGVYIIHDNDNFRIRRYGYTINEVKEGIDPKMKHVEVQVEFYPDTRGLQNDDFTTYWVYLIIRP